MKAIVCREFGPPDLLRVEDLSSPEPGPDQVLVSVHAAGLNFPDLLIIQNKYQTKPALPFVPGSELAGVVKKVGAKVNRLKVGDRVMCVITDGAFAEECLVPAHRAVRLPERMDYRTGAAFLLTYGTSHHALCNRASTRPGETLLVLGAAGGVGLAAVEIGKVLGLEVIACASSDEKLAVCREHGADHLINYASENLRERVKAITAGKGADVVYDAVGGSSTELALRASAWRGRLLVVGFAAGEIPRMPLNLPLLSERSIVGVHWGAWLDRSPAEFEAGVDRINEWFSAGKLRPHISATYPLESAAAAMKSMMDRKVTGKVVLTIS
jgi:NADPH2:quinone reductase